MRPSQRVADKVKQLKATATTPAVTVHKNAAALCAHQRPLPPAVPPLQLTEVTRLKQCIQEKNNELYALQLRVLRCSWGDDQADPEALALRCQAIEDEISFLCADIKTARVIEDPTSSRFSAWREKQQENTESLRERVSKLSPSSPANAKAHIAEDARWMEQKAQAMVRALRVSLSRSDLEQFRTWKSTQTRELAMLEMSLAAAASSGDQSQVEQVVTQLEACHADLEKMVQQIVSSSDSSDSSESDSDMEYEGMEALTPGDTVKLICEAEDGFTPGEEAIIVEVDYGIAYPYRLKAVGSEANGFFKACDVELVRRRNPAPSVVPLLSPNGGGFQPLRPTKRAISPYTEAEDTLPATVEVDLEKGQCRAAVASKGEEPSMVKRIAEVYLNPLASGG